MNDNSIDETHMHDVDEDETLIDEHVLEHTHDLEAQPRFIINKSNSGTNNKTMGKPAKIAESVANDKKSGGK